MASLLPPRNQIHKIQILSNRFLHRINFLPLMKNGYIFWLPIVYIQILLILAQIDLALVLREPMQAVINIIV